jgi:hypothetical protein
MNTFLQRYASEVKGTLSGLDRVRFRGTLRWLASRHGLGSFLGACRILLKDFKSWAQGLTAEVLLATERLTETKGRPLTYLISSKERKEDRARALAAADGIHEGLIGVFKCVEPCYSFSVGPNRARKHLELRYGPSKCAHLYFYLQHRHLGLMHVRLQTWLPFTVHVCLNGREWLAQELRRQGIPFEQRDNCFIDVADVPQAQALLTRQLRTNWSQLLDGLLAEVHPAQATMFGERRMEYYWSADETEWATDLMFHSPESLGRIYPRLLRHGMATFASDDVLRFLGRRPQAWRFHGSDVLSTLKTRPEGTRIKHQLNGNSLKMYDKQGSVLRVETTINNARDFRVYRAKEGDPDGAKSWQALRKGVADLHRRAEVSQQSNERYLEALAAVDHPQTLREATAPVCQPKQWRGRRVRALHPFGNEDRALLEGIGRGEFAINGFRNRDLRPLLGEPPSPSPAEKRRHSGRITRMLRLLRAHGIIRKIPKSHRYRVTPQGRTLIVALASAQNATTQQLAALAG